MNFLNATSGLRSLHKVSENMRLAAFPILSLFSNYPNQGKNTQRIPANGMTDYLLGPCTL